ncbi:MAG TPA: hypothetical protein VI935_06535 [Thermodesulfobacteriota bacterium]|nr:hypothetical protein [Thermodesulfobacteriota bacterium]
MWILAATNRTEMLDAALLRPERFDLILELPIPDERLRLEILKIHTEVCLVLSVQQSEAGS